MTEKKKTLLKNILLKELSVVKRGANQEANILLLKSEDEPVSDTIQTEQEVDTKPFLKALREFFKLESKPDTIIETEKVADSEGDEAGLLPEDLAKKLDVALSDVEKLTAENNDLKILGLGEVEKGYFSTLDDESKTAFLALTPEQKIEKAKTFMSEQTVEKSANEIALEKQLADANTKLAEAESIAKEAKDAKELAEIEKRATTELAKLDGTPSEKAQILKAVEAIEDEKVRGAILKHLKKSGEALEKELGQRGVDGTPAEGETAETKLSNLAKSYASENKVDYGTAFTVVVKSDEGRKLYAETQMPIYKK